MSRLKTPGYQRNASANYKTKHDVIQVTLDLGEREKLRSVGIDNNVIRDMIRTEYKKRKAEADQEKLTAPDDPLPDWFTSPY